MNFAVQSSCWLVVQGHNKATLGGVSVASGKPTKKRKHKKHYNTSAQNK